MKATLKIHLRRNERLFINGAVLKADRKVTLEFLNDVTFLLESHVLQQEDATSPLRQLYYIIQLMQIDPASAMEARKLYADFVGRLNETYSNREIRDGLSCVRALMEAGRIVDSMKALRALFAIEDALLNLGTSKAVA